MKILLAVDGSAQSLEAVRFVVRLVDEGLQASLLLANVQEPASLYELVRLHDAQAIEQVSAGAAVSALEVARALLDRAEIGFEAEAASGEAAHTLVELAERFGCDAIVMGARGLGDSNMTGLGSVAHAVLNASAVPVTIVKRATQADASAEPDDELRDDSAPHEPGAASR